MIDVTQLVKGLPTVAESGAKGKVTRETQQTREAALIGTREGTLARQIAEEEVLPTDEELQKQLHPLVSSVLPGFVVAEQVYGLLLTVMCCKALHRSRKMEFSAPRELGATTPVEWRRETRVFPYGKSGYVAAMRGCGLGTKQGDSFKPDFERADAVATALVDAGVLKGRGRSGYLLAGIAEAASTPAKKTAGVKRAAPVIEAGASTWALFAGKTTVEEAVAAADKASAERKAAEVPVTTPVSAVPDMEELIRQAALKMIQSGMIQDSQSTTSDTTPAKGRGRKGK